MDWEPWLPNVFLLMESFLSCCCSWAESFWLGLLLKGWNAEDDLKALLGAWWWTGAPIWWGVTPVVVAWTGGHDFESLCSWLLPGFALSSEKYSAILTLISWPESFMFLWHFISSPCECCFTCSHCGRILHRVVIYSLRWSLDTKLPLWESSMLLTTFPKYKVEP